MPKLFFFISTLAFAFSARAASNIPSVVKNLTVLSVAVRAEVSCLQGPALQNVAGAQLEKTFDGQLGEIQEGELTQKIWQSLKPSQCLNDCSCDTLSRLYDKFPEKMKKKIRNKDVEKKLSKMTDKNYRQCAKKISNICGQPEVVKFVKDLQGAAKDQTAAQPH